MGFTIYDIASFELLSQTAAQFTNLITSIRSTIIYIYNYPMTTNTIEEVSVDFDFQWSWNEQEGYTKSDPNPAYFSTNSTDGLVINIYTTDQPFQEGSSTAPRSEIRGLKNIWNNVQYTCSFDQYFPDHVPPFDFCWFQIFGQSGPNIMLRTRTLTYGDPPPQVMQLLPSSNPIVELTGTLYPNEWINWRIEFMLATVGGYVKVYQNGVFIGQVSGDTSGLDGQIDEGGSYLKTGIYLQTSESSPQTITEDCTTYTKNLVLYY